MVFLLLVQISLGLISTTITTQSSLDNYLTFDYWAQGLFWFEPNVWQHIAEANVIYKLHIVNGFFIFMIFPYTKLMHMIKAPIMYMFRGNKMFDSSKTIVDKL